MEHLPLVSTHACPRSQQSVLKPIQQALAAIVDEQTAPFEVLHKQHDFTTPSCDQSLLADCDSISR